MHFQLAFAYNREICFQGDVAEADDSDFHP
jgi:hypothetical protein